MSSYHQNRAKFPLEELKRYEGQWVAFSPDGSRIVASCEDFAQLDERVVAAGEDPKEVWFEHVIFEDGCQQILGLV